jgi:transcriptional regulator with XRE-family HTH domain
VAPWSTTASAQIVPPCLRMMRSTVAKPTPVPSNSSERWRRWKTPNNLSAYFMLKPTPLSRTNVIVIVIKTRQREGQTRDRPDGTSQLVSQQFFGIEVRPAGYSWRHLRDTIVGLKTKFESFCAAKRRQLITMSMHDENRFAPGSIAMTKRDKFLAALGNKIRAKRKKKRFSQETLAEKSGMHRTYVADIERGARNVSFVNLIALAAALGQGDNLPESHVVRLVRPRSIGGRVLGPSGEPVPGATVGFNTEEVAASASFSEDHCVDYLTVKTDTEGLWRIDRLAPEMVGRIFGSATHPEYSPSEPLQLSRQPELLADLLKRQPRLSLGRRHCRSRIGTRHNSPARRQCDRASRLL